MSRSLHVIFPSRLIHVNRFDSQSGTLRRSPSLFTNMTATSFLLLLLVSACLVLCAAQLNFTALPNAPWSPRISMQVFLYNQPLSYYPATANSIGALTTSQPPLFLTFGGTGHEDDVWISTNHAASWILIAGEATYTSAPTVYTQYNTTFADRPGAIGCIDSNGVAYYIQGDGGTAPQQAPGKNVWYSLNVSLWTQVSSTTNAPASRSYASCAADPYGNVYIMNGFASYTFNGTSGVFLNKTVHNDVYTTTSASHGNVWTLVTSAAAYPPRANSLTLSYTSSVLAKWIMIVLTGFGQDGATETGLQDVYASSDSGVTWTALSTSVPWQARASAAGAVASNGAIVISGGRGPNNSPAYIDDAWLSLDGGISWQQLIYPSGVLNPRYGDSIIFDENNILYILNGVENGPLTNDVHLSTLSFSNITNNGYSIPTHNGLCIGLTCFPGTSLSCSTVNTACTNSIQIASSSSGSNTQGISSSVSSAGTPNYSFTFNRLLSTTPWSARNNFPVFLVNTTIAYNPYINGAMQPVVTFPPPTFFTFGGDGHEDDIYVSSDHGQTWTMIAGTSGSIYSTYNNTYADRPGACSVVGSNGVSYYIQGDGGAAPQVPSQVVWYSRNFTYWQLASTGAAPLARSYASCVADVSGNVYVMGGYSSYTVVSATVTAKNVTSDVWISSNGIQWAEVNPGINSFPARSHATSLGFTSSVLGKWIMIILAGFSSDGYDLVETGLRDCWASSDNGATWRTLTLSAPWSARGDTTGAVASNGAIVIVGGRGPNSSPAAIDDGWLSLDGGVNWVQLSYPSGLLNGRDAPSVVFDELNQLYVMNGLGVSGYFGDVWQSSVTFNNILNLGYTVPAHNGVCGIGLTCWTDCISLTTACSQALTAMSSSTATQSTTGSASSTAATLPAGTFTFNTVTTSASWSPRDGVYVFRPKHTIINYNDSNGTPVTVNTAVTPTFVLFGTLNSASSLQYNDVWISTSHGQSWSIIAGHTSSFTYSATSFVDRFAPTATMTVNDVILIMGGEGGAAPQQPSTEEWSSNNGGVYWNHTVYNISTFSSTQPFQAKSYAASTSDSKGTVYIMNGFSTYEPVKGNTTNNIYKSTLRGLGWILVNASSAYSPRISNVALSTYNNILNTDLIYVIAGANYNSLNTAAPETVLNDVWISTNGGVNFIALTLQAQFPARTEAFGTVSAAGVLVIGCGRIANSPSTGQFSDMWVSLNGGIKWNQLVPAVLFNARTYAAIVLDEQERVYVMGGKTYAGYDNDIYVTSLSLTNILSWAATTPSFPAGDVPASVGLTCQPVSAGVCSPVQTNTVPSSSSGSSSSSSSGSSGLSSGAIAGIIIGSIIGALCIIGLLCYICLVFGRNKQSSFKSESNTAHDIEMPQHSQHHDEEEHTRSSEQTAEVETE